MFHFRSHAKWKSSSFKTEAGKDFRGLRTGGNSYRISCFYSQRDFDEELSTHTAATRRVFAVSIGRKLTSIQSENSTKTVLKDDRQGSKE